MKNEEKQFEAFEFWITSIPDKIQSLSENILLNEIDLDFTIESLDLIEKEINGQYNIKTFEMQYELWDELAAYAAKVYKTYIPIAEWDIELKNKKDIYYNRPVLRVQKYLQFQPHTNILTFVDRKTNVYLSDLIKSHLQFLTSKGIIK